MTLLTMVQQNPNLPQSFKDTATGIANQAIVVAQDEIAKANQTATTPVVINNVAPVQTVQQPTFGGIITPMDKSDIVIDSIRFLQTNDPQRSPNGEWIIVVRVLNSNGDDEKDAIVKMDAPDDVVNIKEKHIDQMGYVRDAEGNITRTKYSTFFNFAPNSTGDRPITFTSGNLSKTITINVK